MLGRADEVVAPVHRSYWHKADFERGLLLGQLSGAKRTTNAQAEPFRF
jgi:hypothetical protein